jgi:hypothetical protein
MVTAEQRSARRHGEETDKQEAKAVGGFVSADVGTRRSASASALIGLSPAACYLEFRAAIQIQGLLRVFAIGKPRPLRESRMLDKSVIPEQRHWCGWTGRGFRNWFREDRKSQ